MPARSVAGRRPPMALLLACGLATLPSAEAPVPRSAAASKAQCSVAEPDPSGSAEDLGDVSLLHVSTRLAIRPQANAVATPPAAARQEPGQQQEPQPATQERSSPSAGAAGRHRRKHLPGVAEFLLASGGDPLIAGAAAAAASEKASRDAAASADGVILSGVSEQEAEDTDETAAFQTIVKQVTQVGPSPAAFQGFHHHLSQTFSGLSAMVPRPEKAPMLMMQVRARESHASDLATLSERLGNTFGGLSQYVPRAAEAPLLTNSVRTRHNKQVGELFTRVMTTLSSLHMHVPKPHTAPHAMLQTRSGETLQTQSLLSLNTIFSLLLLLAIGGFALLLYHNNYNVEETVQEIQANPSEAMKVAQGEAMRLYQENLAKSPKAMCC